MKGYKAFENGMVCKGKQYAENTVYEEQGGKICGEGVMHYCETPFDVWDYYPVVNENGNFSEYAEVEPLAEVQKDGNKRATKKLRIGAKLNFRDFIEAGVHVMIETTKPTEEAVSDTKIGSIGNYTQIGSIGNYTQVGSSDNYTQVGSIGNYTQIGSIGNYTKIGSSGYGVQIGSSGNYTQICSSDNFAKIGSSGNYTQINLCGTDSVGAAIGPDSMVKGVIGDWIVLAEWKKRDNGSWYPDCVKAGFIDGETLKENTWYKLADGEFVERYDSAMDA